VARTAGSTAEITQQRILDAARDLFTERGYAGTSIRDVAERLSMTKAALYYHFPGKQAVLAALVEPWLAEIDELADWAEAQESVDREEALRRTIGLFAEPSPAFSVLMNDPSALHDSAARLNVRPRMRRLERAFAGGDEDRLPVRCALGAVRAGILGTLLARDGSGEFAERELDAVLRGALAAWDAASEILA
jgi:AcrR family transcriptional regulator